MSQDEVLRMVAKLRDDVTSPLSRIEKALHGVGKRGKEESKALRQGFRSVHDEFRKVTDVARTGLAPAIEAIGISSFSAVGAVAALTAGLKNFVDQGTDVAAFGRRVQLTADTIRGLEGVAEKFQVDPAAIRQGEQTFVDQMYLIRRHRGELYAHLLAQRREVAQELAATPETVEGNERALRVFLKLLDDIKRPGSHGLPTARMFSKEVFGTDAFVDLLRDGNAGLEEAVRQTLALRGAMDTDAAQKWVNNWSDFKAAIEGVRNAIGNDLLPDLTQLAKQGQSFFSDRRVEIGRGIADAVRDMGTAAYAFSQDLPGIERFFDRVARVWHILNMTPGQIVTKMLGGKDGPFFKGREYATPDYSQIESFSPFDSEGYNQNLAAHASLHRRAIGRRAFEIIKGLRDRGLDAEHAAILGGNIEQESGFDPTRPNEKEGSIGLIQWRLERRAALDALAAKRHKLETDAATQLDFLMQELQDTPQGRAFLAARAPEEMNRALHGFIRYGDNSQLQRLIYGKQLLPIAQGMEKPGSLLAAADKNAMSGWAASVTGSASIKVDVNAPPNTSVKADADGLFDRVQVNRGLSMPRASETD